MFIPQGALTGPDNYSEKRLLHGSNRFEGHAIAQPFDPPREPVDQMVSSTFVKVRAPRS